MTKQSGMIIKNMPELRNVFQQLRIVGNIDAIRAAALAGIKVIGNEAVKNSPYLTGTYKRSQHQEVIKENKRSVYVAHGTNVDYAKRLEFGFEGVDSLGRTYHQAARPHIRPAYDTKKKEAIKEVKDALISIAKQVTK